MGFLSQSFLLGVLDLILPLLESQHTRQLALFALSALCGHDGLQVRLAVFKHSNYIVGSIRDSLDDFKATLFGTASVLICQKTVFDEYIKAGMRPEPVIQMVRESMDITLFLETTLESLTRNYTHPIFMSDGAVDIISFNCMIASEEVKAHPSSICFLVAGLRSKKWVTRGKCLAGLLGFT